MNNDQLKQKVHAYWNAASCGTEYINQEKYSQNYFNAIEQHRYTVEPEIFTFAQFSRFHGKKVLEVGVGAGTDFVQWVRSGAQAHGIDLTQEAIENTQKRLELYGLQAQEIQVADAEHLPYPDNFFDLVYSWGVIHHSPDMQQCLREIIRVTKPSGIIKLMIYNKHSLFAFYQYIRHGLLKGKPFAQWDDILYNHQESIGTKAYTIKQIRTMLAPYPVDIRLLQANVTKHDLLWYKGLCARAAAYILASLCGWNSVGWFMTIELEKR